MISASGKLVVTVATKQWAIIGLACLLLVTQPHSSLADARYKAYARNLIRSLPASARIRPDMEKYLTARANAERKKQGRTRLKPSPLLVEAARAQAAEMIRGNFVGHHTKGGFDFGDRVRAYMPKFEGLRGENAARDRRGGKSARAKADRVFRQWLNSRGHRRNLIRSDYRFISSGVIEVGGHLYAVQIFWEPAAPRQSINQLLIN